MLSNKEHKTLMRSINAHDRLFNKHIKESSRLFYIDRKKSKLHEAKYEYHVKVRDLQRKEKRILTQKEKKDIFIYYKNKYNL